MSVPRSRESSFYFGEGLEPLFGVLHSPASDQTALDCGVLLCGPLGHELAFSRRFFVEWARSLAAAGFWAFRFDYRGHGDSGGSFEDCDLETLLGDISSACAELERRTGISALVLCGLRFGATLAALWAEQNRPGCPLVLWEPVSSGRSYLAELRRIQGVKQMAERSGSLGGAGGAGAASARSRFLVVEGQEWTPRLIRAIEPLDLGEAGRSPGAFVVRMPSPAVDGRRVKLALAEVPGPQGNPAPRSFVTPPLWYGSFLGEYGSRIRPSALFAETLEWILGRVGGPRPAAERGARPVSSDPTTRVKRCSSLAGRPIAEELVTLPTAGGDLRGVLTLPEPDIAESPVLLLAPHGYNPRAGWNRLYVRIARTLASRGFRCLRFDALGFGDSDGRVDLDLGAEVFVAIERGLHVEDTSRIVSFCAERLPSSPIFVGGVCGGAVTSVFLAARDRRLAGIALLELPFVLTQNPGVREAHPLWRYKAKVSSFDAWRKVLSLRADFGVHLESLREMVVSRLSGRGREEPGRWFRAQAGPNVNGELLEGLRRCLQHEVPILFIFGTTDNDETFEQLRPRLLPGGQAGTLAAVTVQKIAGADHDFLRSAHADQCVDILASWLAERRDAGHPSPD